MDNVIVLRSMDPKTANGFINAMPMDQGRAMMRDLLDRAQATWLRVCLVDRAREMFAYSRSDEARAKREAAAEADAAHERRHAAGTARLAAVQVGS
jgi:hypothetical protein